MWRVLGPFLIVLSVFSGCSDAEMPGISVFSVHSDLNLGQDGWDADFTGYPASAEDSIAYELKFDYTTLPDNLGGKGLMLSGKNIDGHLFMFIKNKVTGLAPNTEYSLIFEVRAASNATTDEDTDGSPGSDVFLKAGASSTEPQKIIANGNCELNLDKGLTASSAGANMIILGNIAANPATSYNYIQRSNSTYNAPFIARSDSNGELWLIIGTDSAYTGKTTIYIRQVDVIFTVPK
ncbi:hypothetical protein [Pseudochryseolinea flava]|nr:hypothetical protein [Pseudochryseolinea flava]